MKKEHMSNVNKTLYIPLYGKAYVSKKGLFLHDPKAEEIWAKEGFTLGRKAKSKWLAYYMGIRAAVFDHWLRQQMTQAPDAVIIHLGCGMDSRVLRVGTAGHPWYDIDFPEVIEERKRYYSETQDYHMMMGDARNSKWLSNIPENKRAIVVMEGVSMYVTEEELRTLMEALCAHFQQIALLMDAYTVLAAKMSKYKNPIREVGVTQVYGMDDPTVLVHNALTYLGEKEMIPARYIDELRGTEKKIFRTLYAGKLSHKLYKLFEYQKM